MTTSTPPAADGISIPATFLFRVETRHDGAYSMRVTDGPYGSRTIAGVTSGSVTGPRVRGTMVTGLSSDWVTVRRDGMWELDVRAGFITDDGATVLYFYTGLCQPSGDGVHMSLRGAPRFQTGDERYTWLNQVQAVAIGQANVSEHRAMYDIYALD
jgi:hypothetical protein